MTERVILGAGRSCGIHFCVHEPRNVKLIAIWETDRNTILFYNSAGERIEGTRVVLASNLLLSERSSPISHAL